MDFYHEELANFVISSDFVGVHAEWLIEIAAMLGNGRKQKNTFAREK